MKYLVNEKFLRDVCESQEIKAPTKDFCFDVKLIIDHMIRGKSFNKYSDSLKDDMRSHALLRSIQALRSFDAKKTENAFGYWTRTIWTAFLQVLNDHYKQVNIRKEMIERSMAEYDNEFGGNRLERFEMEEWK